MDDCRTALKGTGEKLLEIVSQNATPAQWAEWLRTPLEHALAEGDQHLASTLLSAGADGGSGWKGCDGRSLLDAAAEGGNSKSVSTLLEAGSLADLNVVSGSERRSPLHRAIAGGHTAAARLLLLAGADVSLLDSRKRGALHYAVQGGHGVLAGDVIIAGAEVNAADKHGETPLHLSAAAGDNHSVYALLHRGARVGAVDGAGRCPLHAAVRAGHKGVVEALLKAGADPSARYGTDLKNSPLQLACSSKDAEMTRILLRYGADAEGCDGFGFTALHWAAYRGEPCVIDALVRQAGADTEARSSRVWLAGHQHFHVGLTPLHIAAFFRRNNAARMTALLRNGADVNARDGHGQTPLHIVAAAAAKPGSAAAVDFLLRWGADETVTDNYGRTPDELVVDSDVDDPTKHVQELLANARVDRAWRRRGMLVLCRAHVDKALKQGGGALAGKMLRQVGTPGLGGGGAFCGRETDWGGLVARVIGLEAEEVFGAIVRYL